MYRRNYIVLMRIKEKERTIHRNSSFLERMRLSIRVEGSVCSNTASTWRNRIRATHVYRALY